MLKLNKVSLAMAAAFFMVIGGVANAGDSTSFGNVNANLAAPSDPVAQARADAAYALAQANTGRLAAGGLTLVSSGMAWNGSEVCGSSISWGRDGYLYLCYSIINGKMNSRLKTSAGHSTALRTGFPYYVASLGSFTQIRVNSRNVSSMVAVTSRMYGTVVGPFN